MAEDKKADGLILGPDDTLPTSEATVLGLQHVLAMDAYVGPLLIASMLALSATQTSSFLQAAFLACGFGTIIQTAVFMKMPLSQGPSFVPASAIVGIYFANGGNNGGMSVVLTSCLIGALLLILLGISGWYEKIINHLLPPVVGGTIITCVGLGNLPNMMNSNIFHAAGNDFENIALAGITVGTLLVVVTIGTYITKLHRFLKVSSIIITMIVGIIVSMMMGRMDWSSLSSAAWFSFPKFTMFHYGLNFNLSATITFIIIYMVLTAETTGTWFAMSAVTGKEIKGKQWNHGMIGEGISCLASVLIGSVPMTGYSTNAGIVSITGVASRKVFVAAGFWFMGLGLFSKLAALLAAIPSPVIGGIGAVVLVIIMLNGLNTIGDLKTAGNQSYIIGIPISVTMALALLPDKFKEAAPQMLQYLIGSPIAVAAITAIVLNLILNRKSMTTVQTEGAQ